MKISAYLLCTLTALGAGIIVAIYAASGDPLPTTAGALVFCLLVFVIQVADGIRRGP
jgi:uncharacterized membrane protein (DUF441 family)